MNDLPSLEWFAGVFDASGYAGLCRNKLNPKVLTLKLERQEPLMVMAFSKRFGGKVQVYEGTGATRWVWVRWGRSARAVLMAMHPFLQVRRAEVERLCAVDFPTRGRPGSAARKPASLGNELQRVSA